MVLPFGNIRKSNSDFFSGSALQEMILRAISGDISAFGSLYDLTHEKVYRSIFYRTLDQHITEDIVTTVYMKVLRNISKYRGKTDGEFFSWLLRIGYTTMIDFLRKSSDTDPVDNNSTAMSYTNDIGMDVDNREKIDEVLHFLNTLSVRDRNIFTMRIWDDLSYEEISIITGESVSNTKKVVSRTLEKITANISYCFLFFLLFSYVI